MWNFICNWLPVIAFLTGTALGGLLYYFLYSKDKEKDIEDEVERERQEKMQLQNDLLHHNTITETQTRNLAEQLQYNRSEYENLSGKYSKTLLELSQINKKISKLERSKKGELNIENQTLKQKLDKLKKAKKKPKPEVNYLNEYQSFLQDLENTIKKAKKSALGKKAKAKEKGHFADVQEKKKGKKKKKKEKNKSSNKYKLYKEKFDKEKSLGNNKPYLIDDLKFEPKRNRLTELFGIDNEIEAILNKEGIKTYAELSRTRIARLREILAFHGAEFENIDPLNWPIQARIAEKGQWSILDEYKKRMSEED